MKADHAQRPLVLLDLRKPRIRIHKNVLHALGNPEYVLLLVNPVERLFAITVGDRSDHRAHHISWSAAARKKSFEIYSSSFMDALRLCSDWDENQAYRIYGKVIEERGVIQFRVDDAFKYGNDSESKEDIQ